MNTMIRERIRANPSPHETHVIARAQSLLTRNGRIGPVLPFHVAERVLRRAERKARPEPNH